jgi:hypothetical protein
MPGWPHAQVAAPLACPEKKIIDDLISRRGGRSCERIGLFLSFFGGISEDVIALAARECFPSLLKKYKKKY